jgi:hypothetical protein
MSTTTATTITPNTRYANDLGMWAELRFDAQGGYVPGLGAQGVWYAVTWAPYFPSDKPMTMADSRDRARVESAIRRWIATREFPPAIV